MDYPMLSAEPIIFAVTKVASDKQCIASIVSSHRCIDVAFLESTWTVRSCTRHPIELVCGTFALETVSYASNDSIKRMAAHDLIREAGQNQTSIYLSSPMENFELPLFLTTGRPELVYRYRLHFRLVTRFWG